MKNIFFTTIVVASAMTVLAQTPAKDFPIPVYSNSSGDGVANAPASAMVTRTGQGILSVRIHNSCFGTNLRSVGNPLSPDSIINTNISLNISGKSIPIKVNYPGALVTAAGMSNVASVAPMDPSTYTLPNGGSAGIFGNTVFLQVPVDTSLTLKPDGTSTFNEAPYVESYSFNQIITSCDGGPVYGAYGHSSHSPTYPCGAFMGKNGPLSASIQSIAVASDNTSVEMYVSFPGQTGFCGGYWSPLMLFFDEGRPKFTNQSKFPLNPTGQTTWPEAGAPGYFLVYDKVGKGEIKNGTQLFGESSDFRNGFDKLAKLDTNHDKMISAKDQEFKYLYLWQDVNGDGVAQKPELISLAQKVTKISLNYKGGILHPLGKFAEEREKSIFWYKTANGKMKKGDIIDIWLAPVPQSLAQKAPAKK